MRQIDLVQKEHQSSLIALAKGYADRGLPLSEMAEELGLNYSSLKRGLVLRGYHHPVGIGLVAARIEAETRWPLKDYVAAMVDEGLSRNTIAKELGVDNKTLQAFADRNGLVIPAAKPVPKDFTNIIKAIRLRAPKRDDLFWIEYDGNRKYLAQWAKDTGIPRSTIKKRLAMGWSVKDALTAAVSSKRSLPPPNAGFSPKPDHPWRKEIELCLLNRHTH